METMREKGIMQARYDLKKRVEKEGVEFGELWESGSWCVLFKNGFGIEGEDEEWSLCLFGL